MLQPVNVPAGPILSMFQPNTLSWGKSSVAPCVSFESLDFELIPFQATDFAAGQFAASDSLMDAPLLPDLPVGNTSRKGRIHADKDG